MPNQKVEHVDTVLDADYMKDLCQSLRKNEVSMLSLRQCQIRDAQFKLLTQAIGRSSSLLQLMLTVGMLSTSKRVEMLAHALHKNKSVTVLSVYGSKVGEEGMRLLTQGLHHHTLLSLDIGDCDLTDGAIQYVCQLAAANEERDGLTSLSLSANPKISEAGWARFSMVLGQCPGLQRLSVDYNRLGHQGGACLLVGLAANHQVEELDLESTGITEETVQLLLHLLTNYTSNLRRVQLNGNKVKKVTLDAVKDTIRARHQDLSDGEQSDSDVISSVDWSVTGSVVSVADAARKGEVESDDASTVDGEDGDTAVEEIATATDAAVTHTAVQSLGKDEDASANNGKTTETELDDFDSECEELKEVPVYKEPVWPKFGATAHA